MTVYGNGFLAYHLEVQVAEGQAAAAKGAVSDWKGEMRGNGTWPGFPETLVTRLRALPGVTGVTCEGPQSAVLIPLRMARGMTALQATMSAVTGTGPITRTIESDLARWGVCLENTKLLPEADMPLEFSFREPGGRHDSLRLYPASRAMYRASVRSHAVVTDHLVLNRFNKGLFALAEDVAHRGGILSFRPHELGRYDRVEDYLSVLPFTAHLVLSTRHDVMRKLARHAGIVVPRKWPNNISTLADEACTRLVEWLSEMLPESAIVVLHRYPEGDSAFFKRGEEPVLVGAPRGYDTASRAARVQGALLGSALTSEPDAQEWGGWCTQVVENAFRGTEQRPWSYPSC